MTCRCGARSRVTRAVTRNWQTSAIFQAQSGFPLTISVFGDTANAGTALGENPVRANVTGKPVFGAGTRNATTWFNPAAFAAPPAYAFGNVGRNSVVGPGMETMDVSVLRGFALWGTPTTGDTWRVLQCAEPYESGNAEPVCKHRGIRFNHRSDYARKRDSGQCAALLLALTPQRLLRPNSMCAAYTISSTHHRSFCRHCRFNEALKGIPQKHTHQAPM